MPNETTVRFCGHFVAVWPVRKHRDVPSGPLAVNFAHLWYTVLCSANTD